MGSATGSGPGSVPSSRSFMPVILALDSPAPKIISNAHPAAKMLAGRDDHDTRRSLEPAERIHKVRVADQTRAGSRGGDAALRDPLRRRPRYLGRHWIDSRLRLRTLAESTRAHA